MSNSIVDSSSAQTELAGPKGWPILGNALEFGGDPLAFLQECASSYGDIVPIRIGAWPGLIVHDLPLIETILVKEHEKFIKQTLF